MSKEHWLAFRKVAGIGGVTARHLLSRFGSIEGAWEAPDEELMRVPRMKADMVTALRSLSPDRLRSELAALDAEGLGVLTWDDDDYPANLRPVGDAPPLLFLRGELRAEDARAVAIVGSREATRKGLEYAEGLACELARRGVTIVSGLALGIDTAAHTGALQAA